MSTVMTFMSYELMVSTDVQRKLQQEIDEMNQKLDGNKVNYEQIQGMKYMDQVVCETLRKWPPAPAVDRCVALFIELVSRRTQRTFSYSASLNQLVFIHPTQFPHLVRTSFMYGF